MLARLRSLRGVDAASLEHVLAGNARRLFLDAALPADITTVDGSLTEEA
jgi:hypothetical protein